MGRAHGPRRARGAEPRSVELFHRVSRADRARRPAPGRQRHLPQRLVPREHRPRARFDDDRDLHEGDPAPSAAAARRQDRRDAAARTDHRAGERAERPRTGRRLLLRTGLGDRTARDRRNPMVVRRPVQLGAHRRARQSLRDSHHRRRNDSLLGVRLLGANRDPNRSDRPGSRRITISSISIASRTRSSPS